MNNLQRALLKVNLEDYGLSEGALDLPELNGLDMSSDADGWHPVYPEDCISDSLFAMHCAAITKNMARELDARVKTVGAVLVDMCGFGRTIGRVAITLEYRNARALKLAGND
jgi:hypothetical protein